MLQSLRTCIHSVERCSIFLFHNIHGSLSSFLEIHNFNLCILSRLSLSLIDSFFSLVLQVCCICHPIHQPGVFLHKLFVHFCTFPLFLKLECPFDSSFLWLNFYMKSPTVQLSLVHPKSTSFILLQTAKTVGMNSVCYMCFKVLAQLLTSSNSGSEKN